VRVELGQRALVVLLHPIDPLTQCGDRFGAGTDDGTVVVVGRDIGFTDVLPFVLHYLRPLT
jgi:hypothetical protein